MHRFVGFVDSALHDIERDVASHPPERGGALLGPIGQPVISSFIYDPRATTSGATYQPSPSLQHDVTEAEKRDPNIELKGMLHSHPAAMNFPSGGDRIAYADSLRGAPWLGRFVCPIVTVGRRARDSNEIQTPSGVISVFVSALAHNQGVDLQPAIVQVLPITGDVADLASVLGAEPLQIGTVELGGVVYITAGVHAKDLELQMLFPAAYPNEPPLVLATRLTSDTMRRRGREARRRDTPAPVTETIQLPVLWRLDIPENQRLKDAVISQLNVSPAKTTQSVRSGSRPMRAEVADVARNGIRERLNEVVSEQLSSRRVLVAGAGSGGSLTADALARCGIERFTLIDGDVVSAANLSRSVYQTTDIDRPKTEALAEHLAAINPRVECTLIEDKLQVIGPDELDKLILGSDLVIGATDDPSAQRILNHFSYARGIPAIFAGMYARGVAGEIIFTVPGLTKCYRCTTASRHQDDGHVRTLDYGTGRLSGEPALGADISHVVSASIKIAVGLLQLEEESTNPSADMVLQALTAGYNYVIISTTPSWSFFRELFRDTPGQHAYQSAWLATRGDPNCPVCGDHPVDPLTAPSRAPRVDTLVVGDPASHAL